MSQAWIFEEKNKVGVLSFDRPGSDVNVLTTEHLTEFKTWIEKTAAQTNLEALVIRSAKSRIFIAGADINEIAGISTEQDAFEKAEQGKSVFQKLENLKIPTVCVINGACLGGGYELALACTFRVASFADQVKIGLPEANLGILPGFGGSIRLPRLLGLTRALPLILAGRVVSAKDALKYGMVDRLFPAGSLDSDALAFAHQVIQKKIKTKKKPKGTLTWFLEETGIGRAVVFSQARKGVALKAKNFYPAPYEIIKLLEKTAGRVNANAYRLESEHFARLGTTPVSKNLIKLFFMSEKYKKIAWTKVPVKAVPVQKCGVIGAGVMGGAIAQLVSAKNIPVRVKDINDQALGGALKEARQIYKGALKRKKVTSSEMERKMNLISVGLTPEGLRRCDVIVEAVVEDLGIKQKVFKDLGERVPAETILASNTSSLPVTQMAAVTKHPERVIGLHFFNPVDRMPLVEVIRAEQTSDATVERMVQFARLLGKTVIVVKDAPGFLVNRLLLPYMNEAAYLLEEGMSPAQLDRLVEGFGMPMGPVELADQVGIDVGVKVAHILQDAFGARMKVASILEDVKQKGLLGKKSGKGFYLYAGKKKTTNPDVKIGTRPSKVTEEDALKRMIYIMINEAARCLEEGVIDGPETVDMGMIMGTGFPPFRGGLLRYADQTGIQAIVDDLERFAAEVDRDRFQTSPYLKKLAAENRKFYP